MSRPVKKEVSVREIEIRRAVPAEAEAISLLIREAFAPFESEYTAEAFEYTTPSADAIRPRFDEGPIWVAIDNDVMVGTVSGLRESDRFYIRSMAIKPTAQRLGVGQKLLETLEAFAFDAGYDTLYLYTTFVLPGAKRLYEKNGFYVLRETTPEEWCNMGGLEMEKKLK
jgi:ribosomal protein S18 acetylase RimI-like enzyme